MSAWNLLVPGIHILRGELLNHLGHDHRHGLLHLHNLARPPIHGARALLLNMWSRTYTFYFRTISLDSMNAFRSGNVFSPNSLLRALYRAAVRATTRHLWVTDAFSADSGNTPSCSRTALYMPPPASTGGSCSVAPRRKFVPLRHTPATRRFLHASHSTSAILRDLPSTKRALSFSTCGPAHTHSTSGPSTWAR